MARPHVSKIRSNRRASSRVVNDAHAKDLPMAMASSQPAAHRTGSVVPKFEVRPTQASTADTDVVAIFQDKAQKSVVPKGKYAKSVEKLRKSETFSGRAGQIQFLRLAGKG